MKRTQRSHRENLVILVRLDLEEAEDLVKLPQEPIEVEKVVE